MNEWCLDNFGTTDNGIFCTCDGFTCVFGAAGVLQFNWILRSHEKKFNPERCPDRVRFPKELKWFIRSLWSWIYWRGSHQLRIQVEAIHCFYHFRGKLFRLLRSTKTELNELCLIALNRHRQRQQQFVLLVSLLASFPSEDNAGLGRRNVNKARNEEEFFSSSLLCLNWNLIQLLVKVGWSYTTIGQSFDVKQTYSFKVFELNLLMSYKLRHAMLVLHLWEWIFNH